MRASFQTEAEGSGGLGGSQSAHCDDPPKASSHPAFLLLFPHEPKKLFPLPY